MGERSEPATHKVGLGGAVALSIIAPGLGLVYVGRLRAALVYTVTIIGILALAGWSRVVFNPYAVFPVAAIALSIGLVPIIYSARIAYREGKIAARPYNRWWVYVLWFVAWIFMVEAIVAVRSAWFGFEPLHVPASSMAPTIETGDFIMADTWRYDRVDPAFGDLTIFTLADGSGVKYVKRLVGLPGDTIEIRDDVLIRNGEAVNEPYIQLMNPEKWSRPFGPVTTPDEHYFMLGDNRNNSLDSRFSSIGYVHKDQLFGRVEHRWFSFDGGIRWERFPEKFAYDGD
ncbi:MAG: signal peptidase I [Pseudomonadota bacterium]